MGKILQLVFATLFLIAIIYLAIQGLALFFDWLNPGGGSGRIARLTTGVIVGLGVAIGIVVWRRFRGK